MTTVAHEIDKAEPPNVSANGVTKIRNNYRWLRMRILLRMLRSGKLTFWKMLNAAYCYLALFLRLERSGWSPYLINFELWNECNESCLFCRSAAGDIYNLSPNSDVPLPKGKLPMDVYKGIIDQVAPTLLMSIPYINGEPLLSRNIYECVRYCTDKKVATMIATNGMILNEANARKLLEAGLDFIKIHISGFTRETHRIEHRLGDVEVIKKNIENFVKLDREGRHGTLVMLDYITYNHNRHEIEDARAFANRLGIMFNMRPGNPRFLEDTEPKQLTKPLPQDVPCDWLWTVLTVDWNRKIYPCCEHVMWSDAKAYAEFITGETDIREVWNGEDARRWRRTHAKEGRKPIDICRYCPHEGVKFKW